ncbi:hypothetical protein REPUB_Repub08aG0018400 [Reevesia pubescens]
MTENVCKRLLNFCNGLASLKQIHSSLTASGIINCDSHLVAKIIIKYAKFGDHNSACSVFDTIHGDNPNSFLWNTMIRAYANGGSHVEALELYSFMRKTDMYAKCGQTDEGFKILDKMPMRDLVCRTTKITVYEQAEQPHKALLLIQKKQLDCVLADAVAIESVASDVGQLGHTMRAA